MREMRPPHENKVWLVAIAGEPHVVCETQVLAKLHSDNLSLTTKRPITVHIVPYHPDDKAKTP